MPLLRVIATANLAMLAACWHGPVAQPATPTPDTPIHIQLRAGELYSAAALADRGVVVLASAAAACASPDFSLSVTRFDAEGRAGWVRCLPSAHTAFIAASTRAIWIVRNVDPDAPEHVHGEIHDLAVLDRLALDGTPIETRVIFVRRDEPGPLTADQLAHRSLGVLWLNAARISDDTLVIGGSSTHGRLVDGRWEVRSPLTGAGSGFVLAFPAVGPPRAVIDDPGIDIEDLDINGGWYVAGGRCWSSKIVTCVSRTALVLEGQLAAPRPSQGHSLDMEYQNLHVAIDAAGDVIVVAAGLDDVVVAGTRVPSACGSPYAITASWTRDGALRFARALGDCHHEAIPVLDVFDVEFRGDRAVVALFVRPDPSSTASIQFDRGELAVESEDSSVVLELDPIGQIGRNSHYRKLQSTGRPIRGGQPDGSLVPGGDVHDVVLAVVGSRVWIAVAHNASLAAKAPQEPCDPNVRVGAPGQDRDGCRSTVLERAIEMIAWGP